MKTIETVAAFKNLRREWMKAELRVGFVPTMGALHPGHLSLIEQAARDCSTVVVSIFVNPTQFNDTQDLRNYPQPRDQDLKLLEQTPTAAVFLPSASEIYADQFRYVLAEKQISQLLCGPRRPGHFDGVLTVVLKLLNIVQPTMAYFGEKDFQQLKLIRDMAQALFLDSQIVACPTIREPDGLAMSSRNTLLTPEQREQAPALFQILQHAPSPKDAIAELKALGFTVDYVEEHWGRRFVAASLGSVRLIDNVEI